MPLSCRERTTPARCIAIFTQDGVKQPRHSLRSIGNQLDHATALKAYHRIRIAKPTQNLPVQHLGSRQNLDRLQFLGRKGSQPKLKQILQLAICTQRTPKLPVPVRARQYTTFPTGAQQAAQQHRVARSPSV